MIVLAAAALLIVAGLTSLAGKLIVRRLPPNQAVPLLTGLALTVALCTGIALSAMAVLAWAQLGPMPRLGHWSAPELREHAGFPVGVGLAASVVVGAALLAAGWRVVRSARALWGAARAARALTPVAGDLVLIDEDVPTAYAVAGWQGRIVVSHSMLAALPAGERQVVLAHEAAHLRYRHHLYRHVAALSAAANPLLRGAESAIALGIERWADEAAAAEVHDRRVTARGVARAALAQAGRPAALVGLGMAAQAGLGMADSIVAERVRALQRPAPTGRWLAPALGVGVAAACWLIAAAVTWRANELIQFAESVVARH